MAFIHEPDIKRFIHGQLKHFFKTLLACRVGFGDYRPWLPTTKTKFMK